MYSSDPAVILKSLHHVESFDKEDLAHNQRK
jgi:hypothetical protein